MSSSVSIFAPAKLNLFLAITGRREDGFHKLVSVVAPLQIGDALRVREAEGSADELVLSGVPVPEGQDNLVLKAARAYRARVPDTPYLAFELDKRLPLESGLGGGSSDAVAALRGIERLCGRRLNEADRLELAAEIGSDCPLFLSGGPVLMRGRGEVIESLPDGLPQRLSGRSVLLIVPAFGVSTPWAFRQVRAEPGLYYIPEAAAERRLEESTRVLLCGDEASLEPLCWNSMEWPVWEKYLTFPALKQKLIDEFGLSLHMSGSGSACFLLPPPQLDLNPLLASLRDWLGPTAFLVATALR